MWASEARVCDSMSLSMRIVERNCSSLLKLALIAADRSSCPSLLKSAATCVSDLKFFFICV